MEGKKEEEEEKEEKEEEDEEDKDKEEEKEEGVRAPLFPSMACSQRLNDLYKAPPPK